MCWSAPFTDVVMAKQWGKQPAHGGLTTIMIQSREMHAGGQVGRWGRRERGREEKAVRTKDLLLGQLKSGHLSKMFAPRGTQLSHYASPWNLGLKL